MESYFSTIFNTRITSWSFAMICFALVLLFFQLLNWLSRPKEEDRLRFMILIFLFITYTFTNSIFPNPEYAIPQIIQYVLTYSTGIVLATYYFYFLLVQMEISFGIYFNPRLLILSLSTFFFFGFLLTFYITGDDQLARYIFIGFPDIIALYFCGETIRRLIRHKSNRKETGTLYSVAYYTSYFGIIFMATMPMVVVFGYLQFWNLTLVNISLLLTATSYFLRHIIVSRIEFEWLQSKGFNTNINLIKLKKSNLTNREIEIAHLLIDETLDFLYISEKLFISKSTCTKHASNIYKKVGVTNRVELIQEISKPYV